MAHRVRAYFNAFSLESERSVRGRTLSQIQGVQLVCAYKDRAVFEDGTSVGSFPHSLGTVTVWCRLWRKKGASRGGAVNSRECVGERGGRERGGEREGERERGERERGEGGSEERGREREARERERERGRGERGGREGERETET